MCDLCLRREMSTLATHIGETKTIGPWLRGGSFVSTNSVSVGGWLEKGEQLHAIKWCCQTGLNCRPLHYQWSALPLSYGSVPRIPDSAKKPLQGGRSLPQGPLARKRGTGLRRRQKRPQSGGSGRGLLQPGKLRADPVPHFLAERRQRLDGADHDLEFDHFAFFIEPDEIDALELPLADIGGKFQRDIMRAGDEGAVIAKILEDLHHRGQHQQGRGAPGNWRLHEWRAKHNMLGQ